MLVPRFYDVSSGRITIDGLDVRDATLRSLRGEIAVAFEEVFLFSDSVRANIAYGRPDATEDEIVAVARLAQADGFIRHLPKGYDTIVGERGLTLSGGQRQRIALARALLTNPSVMVLDDATSSIDAETEERIHDALQAIVTDDERRRRTTILIAHRQSTLRLADRIVVVQHGRVVDDGTYDELVASSAVFRELFLGPSTVEIARAVAMEASVVEEAEALTVEAAAWPHERVDGRHLAAMARVPNTAGANPGGGRARSMGGGGDMSSALAATPQLLAELAKLPPADDDPELDVEAEMAKPATRFTLRAFSAPFQRGLLIGLLLVVIDTGLTLLGPFFVKRGIDRGVTQGNEMALWLASLGFLGAAIGDWFATRGYTWVTGRTAERMLYALRIRIFAHLQRLSLDYYDRELAGRVMTRMTTDVEALSQLVQTGLITAFVSVLTCVGVLVWLVILSPTLALFAAAVLPFLIGATYWYRRRVGRDLRAGPRPHLRAQRRLPGEPVGRAHRPGVPPGGAQHRVVPRDQRAVPRRPLRVAEADRPVLPVRPAARRPRLRARCSAPARRWSPPAR